MATIELASRARGEVTLGRKPYYVQNIIDMADAVTEKGSALAQADVIQVLSLPANTLILAGGVEAITEHAGTSTDLTLDMGFTGGDVDAFVDGWDYDGAAVGAYAGPVSANFPQVLTAADTVDLLFVTMTGTTTGGIVRVWAWVADLDDTTDRFGGVAQRDATL